MDVEKYRDRLIALERSLAAQASRKQEAARQQVPDSPGDTGDASVSDEGESEDLTEAELDVSTLSEVRGALERIDAGSYGRCEVDGEPIPESRLDAVPWARLCVRHQSELEAREGVRTPSL